jgi:hypothetical protein
VDLAGGLPEAGVRGGEVAAGGGVRRPGVLGESVQELVQGGEVVVEHVEVRAVRRLG